MRGTPALHKLSRRTVGFVKHHSPTILTYLGVAGVAGTAIATAKATSKANELLAEARALKGEELTTTEKVQVAAPIYIPSVLLGTATVACIVGANILNKKTQASLISAYTMLDRSYKDYKAKVTELYGEEANNNIVDSMAKDAYPRQIS